MIPYFPITYDRYEMPMNARAESGSRIEVELDCYLDQLALKERIVASDPRYYVQCPPEATPLAWEALEILLADMAANLPQHFTLQIQGDRWTWENHLCSTTTVFKPGEAASLPLPPLDWLGRQVQEDLILMAAGVEGETVCVGGHLCFGSAWCLNDKVGQTFLRIHDVVPEFRERIGTPSDQLMRRLKPDRPVSRVNWTITSAEQLNLTPALAPQWQASRYGITQDNIAQRVFFRVERQTLTRLPYTRGVLFTIHTYVNTLGEVIADPDRLRRLASVLRDYPIAVQEYKGMTPYFDTLIDYLNEREVLLQSTKFTRR